MTLKQKLASRMPLLGTFIKTPHPHVVEVLGRSGLDLLCIDAEHAPFDRRDIDAAVLAARSVGIPVIVRPAAAGPSGILNALDCGADGVLVPHVSTVELARAAVTASHYGPGGRGYAGSTRAARYGQSAMAEHREAARDVAVIVQIEDAPALERIEEICAVPGLDAIFIGRADLTVALGCGGPDDPPVVAAVERITEAALRAGVPVGMFLARPGDVPQWRERGASLFLLGSDHSMMRSGAAALRAETGMPAPA